MNDSRGRQRGRGRNRPGYGPLLDGTRDAVDAGYQGVEYMLEGLRASFEHRPRGGSGTRRPDGSRTHAQRRRSSAIMEAESGQTGPADLVTQLMSIVAEVLNRAGDAAQAFAEAVVEQSWMTATSMGVPAWLEASAEPGKQAKVDFRVWNPGSSELRNVRLTASDLLGEENLSGTGLVTTNPTTIDRISPHGDAKASVIVSVPSDAKPGEYRALIQADPGEAWAILELTVEQPVKQTVEAARKSARKATTKKTARRTPVRKGTRVPVKKVASGTSRKMRAKKASGATARKTARSAPPTRKRARKSR